MTARGTSPLLDAALALWKAGGREIVYTPPASRPPAVRAPALAGNPYDLVQLPKASGPSKRGSHKMADFAGGCEREAALRHIWKIEPREQNPDFVLGSLIHDWVAYHYAAKMPEDRRPAWFARPLQDALNEDCRGLPHLLPWAEQVYREYAPQVAEEEKDWVILAVEHEFVVTIGDIDPGGPDPSLDHEDISWKPDLLALVPGARKDDISSALIYQDDHKSTRGNGSTKQLYPWKRDGEYAHSWQHLVYGIGINVIAQRYQWPFAIGGWCVDRIMKQPSFQADKHVAPALPERARRGALDTMRLAVRNERELRARVAQGGKPPVPNYSMCWRGYGQGRPCDYARICWADTEAEQADAYNRLYVSKAP